MFLPHQLILQESCSLNFCWYLFSALHADKYNKKSYRLVFSTLFIGELLPKVNTPFSAVDFICRYQPNPFIPLLSAAFAYLILPDPEKMLP